MSLLNSMGRCFSVCCLALLILRQKNPSDIVSALFLVLCGESDSFLCASGICVPRKLQCNGYNDCGDWSDEAHCSTCRAVWGLSGRTGIYSGPGNQSCSAVKSWQPAGICADYFQLAFLSEQLCSSSPVWEHCLHTFQRRDFIRNSTARCCLGTDQGLERFGIRCLKVGRRIFVYFVWMRIFVFVLKAYE